MVEGLSLSGPGGVGRHRDREGSTWDRDGRLGGGEIGRGDEDLNRNQGPTGLDRVP